MSSEKWYKSQRAHYEGRPHRNLLPVEGDVYAEKIAGQLFEALAIRNGAGVEIGCGAGRFTLPLLGHCESLEAIDLSGRQLEVLGAELRRREIAPERYRLHEANIEELDQLLPSGRFDFLVGAFVLHHLHDPEALVPRLCRVVRPGGRIAFVEPNRWNPLYLLQIALCEDMTWKEEQGMYRLGGHRLLRIFEQSGLTDCTLTRTGFFPPQILNRFATMLPVERWLEQRRWLRPVLPFSVISGSVPV